MAQVPPTNDQTAKQRLVDHDTTTEGVGTPVGQAVSLIFNDDETATAATAGTNGDVPAQVVGYVFVEVGGTLYKMPFYNV